MIRFIHDSWEGVMNMDKNPLRHIPDLQVRHLAIQLLAWMWCICFSLYFGSFVVFGFTAVAHLGADYNAPYIYENAPYLNKFSLN